MLSTKGQVIERLLRGNFICRTSDEDGWRFLRVEGNRAQVDAYLEQLNRVVVPLGTGGEGEVFFCGYRHLGEDERRVITQQFRETCQSLTPLADWLVLVQEALRQDAPPTEGSPIRLNEMLGIIEDTPAFREQLARISRYQLFKSSSDTVDAQLKLIFKRLTEQGYLVRPNPDKQIYLATGKLDYLYEVIRFIDAAEGLELERRAETAAQGALL